MYYSFYVVPKEEILPSKSITSAETSSNELSDNEELVNIFCYDNDKIIEDYDFETGNVSLYRDNGNDTISLLYDSVSYENGSSSSSVFTPTGVFDIYFNPQKNIEDIIYITSEKFNTMQDLDTSKYTDKEIYSFILENGYPIVLDGKFDPSPSIDNAKSLLSNLKQVIVQYSMASRYIPASTIIDEILSMVHHYISTGEINEDTLKQRYSELQNFKEMCYDSLTTISPLIEDKKKVDYRNLCEKLQKNSKNISNLIDMYLEDVLKDINQR